MNRLKQSAVAAGLAVGLLTGGAAGAVLGVPGVSGAQETTTTTVAEDTGADSRPDDATRRAEATERLTSTLAPLVEAGTIDQAQADAVVAALVEAGPLHGHGHGPGGRHGGMEAAATALGLDADELHTALEGGQTLAEVAQAQGVDVQVVIDAMVAERKADLDAAVSSGDLTQEQADAELAEDTARITDMVQNGPPAGGPHGPGAPDGARD